MEVSDLCHTKKKKSAAVAFGFYLDSKVLRQFPLTIAKIILGGKCRSTSL